MDRAEASPGEPRVLSRRQYRMSVAYWTLAGAITGLVSETVSEWWKGGLSGIDPLTVSLKAVGMAITIGGAFWILLSPRWLASRGETTNSR